MKQSIDLTRCRRGMAQLHIEGKPTGQMRLEVIEEAIRQLQTNPTGSLVRGYLGVKNYASFGDQRCDCQYGQGPSHGSIVFRIGRVDRDIHNPKPLDADAIYFLEAYRDFGVMEYKPRGDKNEYQLPLAAAIREFDDLNQQRNLLADAFEAANVESHVVVDG